MGKQIQLALKYFTELQVQGQLSLSSLIGSVVLEDIIDSHLFR